MNKLKTNIIKCIYRRHAETERQQVKDNKALQTFDEIQFTFQRWRYQFKHQAILRKGISQSFLSYVDGCLESIFLNLVLLTEYLPHEERGNCEQPVKKLRGIISLKW